MLVGEITALITAILWALSSYYFASATIRIGSVSVNFSRLFLSLILFIITILIFRIPFELSTYQLIMLMASGVAGLVVGDSFFFKSLEYLSARITLLVTSFAPAVSAVMAYFFIEEKLSAINIAGMVIALVGIIIVVIRKEENTGPAKTGKEFRIGILLAFLYTIGQSAGLVLAKAAFNEGEVNSILATTIRIFPAVILLTPVFLFKERHINPFKIFKNDIKAFKDVFIAAVLSAYLGMVLIYIALTKTNVAITSTIIATIPVIQLGISRYFYKENLTWRSVTGAVITVCGMGILFLM